MCVGLASMLVRTPERPDSTTVSGCPADEAVAEGTTRVSEPRNSATVSQSAEATRDGYDPIMSPPLRLW